MPKSLVVYYTQPWLDVKHSSHSGFVSVIFTNSCLMVQSKCLTYDGYRGLGLGNQLILEDLQNIWLSDPAAA